MRAIPIRITFDGTLWRMRSSDGRIAGVFIDRRTAIRQALAETERHPDYVCNVGFPASV
jgi:hypothetical protein